MAKRRLPEEPETRTSCRACGGDFEKAYERSDGRYAVSRCAWCTAGTMTHEQIAKWNAHRK